MTGTPTDASPECGHPASELLDFHVNGSLEGDEAAMVAVHVASCAACARDVRELQSLSSAIEAHGVAPVPAWRSGTLLLGWLGTAAAVLVVGVVVYQLVRPGASERRIASSSPPDGAATAVVHAPGGAPAGSEAQLDLGVGAMRDAAGGPPRINLVTGVSMLRLTLSPPVVPGADLRIGVRGPNDEEILAEQPLPPHDAMGRIALAVPASRFTTSATYQVVLRTATPDAGAGPFTYSFDVQVPADNR